MATYQGDLKKTQILHSLFQVPKDRRDENWKGKLCTNVGDASLCCGEPQLIRGPDGFPYFHLRLPDTGKPFTCYVIRYMANDYLLREGFGVVIQAHPADPEWVFSYGDVVNYHLTGEFYTLSENWSLPAKEIIEEDEDVLIGQPSETFLPGATRAVIRLFLNEVGVEGTKILLMSRQSPQGMTQELVYNLTPERFPSSADFEATMRRISWFMPRHYRFVCMKETGMENNFEPI